MKKRIFSVMTALAIIMTSLLCACTNSSDEPVTDDRNTDSAKLNVVTTIFPPYDFVRAIAGDKVELTMLLAPGGEVHSYEPTASDLLKVQKCDVFIYTGGENDGWVEDTLNAVDSAEIRSLAMIDCVTAVEEEVVDGMETDDEEHEHEHEEGEEPEYDEHVWTSPVNAIKIVRKITETLCAADSENADIYNENSGAYIAKLEALDAQFRDIVSGASRKTLVFADRFPFRYFADEYGLDYYAAFVGCSNQGTASLSTVKFLVDKVKENNIPVVLYIEFSSGEMADTICESTGVRKAEFHSCHNVSSEDFAAGVTYVDIMTENAEVLREALK